MEELLFLAHRIPYPPDKGDKIRSWNFLRHLTEHHRVFLGCFVDEARDWEFVDELRDLCEDCCFIRLQPPLGKLRALRGLLDGRPLTLPYYFDAKLDRWVRSVLARPRLTRVFVYCSAMAHYIPAEIRRSRHCVADLVDVDSEKWFDYARRMSAARAWLWGREGRKLQLVEQEIASSFRSTLVATAAELELLSRMAPGMRDRLAFVPNGVDSHYFSPERSYDVPPAMAGTPIVFTGAMDYWPNADAAAYFAREILPMVRQRLPDARFLVVGANPGPELSALGDGNAVVVTGRVPDVRPYIAHAKAVVAPLRVARGVQNKVLEAMAMARPVIASSDAATGIDAEIGAELLLADRPENFAEAIYKVVTSEEGERIGRRARERVIAGYSWSASLALLDGFLHA